MRLVIILLIVSMPCFGFSQTNLLTVNFEVANLNYTVTNGYFDGGNDYFMRTNDDTLPSDGSYASADGFFFGVSDNDESGSTGYVTTSAVNVTGYTNLQFSLKVAAAGVAGRYERENLTFWYNCDGSGFVLFAGISGPSDSPNLGSLMIDTNLDGLGDAVPINNSFDQVLTFSIPPSGCSTLQIRFEGVLNANEDFAFDDLRIAGTPPHADVVLDDGSAFLPVVAAGLPDQAIGRFALTGSIDAAELTAASVRLDGVRTGMSNVKLWSSTDAMFGAGDTQLGSTVGVDPGAGGTAAFAGFSAPISSSTTYFFVTADVAFGATGDVRAFIAHSSSLVMTNGAIIGIHTEVPLSASAAALPVALSGFTVD